MAPSSQEDSEIKDSSSTILTTLASCSAPAPRGLILTQTFPLLVPHSLNLAHTPQTTPQNSTAPEIQPACIIHWVSQGPASPWRADAKGGGEGGPRSTEWLPLAPRPTIQASADLPSPLNLLPHISRFPKVKGGTEAVFKQSSGEVPVAPPPQTHTLGMGFCNSCSRQSPLDTVPSPLLEEPGSHSFQAVGGGHLHAVPSAPGSAPAPILPWQDKAELSSRVPDKTLSTTLPQGDIQARGSVWTPVSRDRGPETDLAKALLMSSLGCLAWGCLLLAVLLLL